MFLLQCRIGDFVAEPYIINFFRKRKIRDKWLLTTDHGQWVVVSQNLLDNLQKHNLTFDQMKELYSRGLILTENNYEHVVDRTRLKMRHPFGGTSLHIIVTNENCNYACRYCHASAKSGSSENLMMNKETADKVIDFIFQSPSQYIMIEYQGGEPLINFELIKYITREVEKKNLVHKKEVTYSLISNFSLLNQEILDFIMDKKIGLCTSLDGNAEVHNSNRPMQNGQDTHATTTDKIKIIQSEFQKRNIYERNINALVTITKKSLGSYKEIIDEYVNNGFDVIHLRQVSVIGMAKTQWADVGYTPEEFIDFWKKSLDYMIEINKQGTFIAERLIVIFLLKAFEQVDPGYTDLCTPCGAGIMQVAYTIKGDVYTCDEGRLLGDPMFMLGNVKEDTYVKCLTSTKQCSMIDASLNDHYICDMCAYKQYCGLCPVCNYSECGRIITDIQNSSRCKILKEQFDYFFDKIIFDEEARKVFISWFLHVNKEHREEKIKDINKILDNFSLN